MKSWQVVLRSTLLRGSGSTDGVEWWGSFFRACERVFLLKVKLDAGGRLSCTLWFAPYIFTSICSQFVALTWDSVILWYHIQPIPLLWFRSILSKPAARKLYSNLRWQREASSQTVINSVINYLDFCLKKITCEISKKSWDHLHRWCWGQPMVFTRPMPLGFTEETV